MKRIIRAATTPEIQSFEKEHAALARRVCAEGIVLLENKGALPLRGGKAALYGLGVRHCVYGGTGSGENKPRYRVNIEEGFLQNGWEVVSRDWLDEFDREYDRQYFSWLEMIKANLKGFDVFPHMEFIASHPFQPHAGRAINAGDVLPGTDTAVYVLSRQAGEGSDRQTIPGDYYIREDELELIKSLRQHYGKLVLVLNIGAPMDLGFADDVGADAILYLTQGGMETGNGLFDVLTGKVSPCGKLCDSWARRYEDHPCHDTFSTRGGREFEEDYSEGIYVGYRWFDAMGIAPRYAFGHGLSYTDFSVTPGAMSSKGSEITLRAAVRNRGGEASGREVVQLYVSAPEGRLRREVKSLAAYAKTGLLAPGASQQLELKFDLRDLAAYDAEGSQYILEKGEYVIYIGSSSDKLVPAGIVSLDSDAVTEICTKVCPVRDGLELITPPARERAIPDAGGIIIRGADIRAISHDYAPPALERSPEIDAIMARLGDRDLARLLVGRGYFGGGSHNTAFGCAGSSTSALLKKGIDNMLMADGPQGLNLAAHAKKPRQNIFTVPVLPAGVDLSPLGRIIKLITPGENSRRPDYYQFCTAWPCETAVAQTWDRPLAEEMGRAIGKEMLRYGIVFWLAPAMNIHRNPLCGRNFEYYSEDPLLSGKTAAAVTMGVQSHSGCYATVKHFACNNLENSRNRYSSNLDERTLREIYLKGFRIAIEEGGAKAVMSSYNRVNGVYAANSHDLLTKVLRNEWGFDGIVMTDWYGTGHHEALDELGCAAGNDLLMPGKGKAARAIEKALKDGRISQYDVESCARRIIKAELGCCLRK